MGCSDCKTGCGTSDGGCSTQKSAQRLFLDDLLPKIYPSRTYGQLDVAAAYEAGIREEECEQLGRQIATVTKAPVYLVLLQREIGVHADFTLDHLGAAGAAHTRLAGVRHVDAGA